MIVIQSIMMRSVILQIFEVPKLIFGHFKNVQKLFQPINNARLPNNSNTY
jgi:hypothetical protein